MCLFPGMPSGSSHHLHPPSGDDDSALGSLPPDELDESRLTVRRPIANINPFTPDGEFFTENTLLLK